jgi:peptide subunit release factor 1 (eRF1)
LGAGCAWGEIAWDAVASVNQLLAAARGEIQAVRARAMEALVARISEGLGPLGKGVSGFEDTMDALRRGQVQTLVVDRNARPPGWLCLQCDFVSITDVVVCPVCDGQVVPLDDVLGEAVRVAILQNTFVEVAEEVPALESMGHIAGILRFR